VLLKDRPGIESDAEREGHRNATAQAGPGEQLPAPAQQFEHGAVQVQRRRDADRPRRERDGDGQQRSRENAVAEIDPHDLEHDQHEEHGVQDPVDQGPEVGQVLARADGHRLILALRADDEADHDHRQRARNGLHRRVRRPVGRRDRLRPGYSGQRQSGQIARVHP
jgi:hypothetical protein